MIDGYGDKASLGDPTSKTVDWSKVQKSHDDMCKYAWEYEILELKDTDLHRSEEYINRLGRQGWELVSVTVDKGFHYTTHRFYFKRQILIMK